MSFDATLIVRVPMKWHQRLKAEAALKGTTPSQLMRAAIGHYLELNSREAEGRGKREDAAQER